jgi:hypothetical protein
MGFTGNIVDVVAYERESWKRRVASIRSVISPIDVDSHFDGVGPSNFIFDLTPLARASSSAP